MGVTDWNWRLPWDGQEYPWDCACCSTAWCLRSVDKPWTEQQVAAAMYPTYVNPSWGLLDASGAGLVEWLGRIGVRAAHNPEASYQDVLDAAGYQPMVIGGRNWNHWVAVRMGPAAAGVSTEYPQLWLMNPAPGWGGVEQYLGEDSFDYLGPFSAVWFEAWGD